MEEPLGSFLGQRLDFFEFFALLTVRIGISTVTAIFASYKLARPKGAGGKRSLCWSKPFPTCLVAKLT